MCVSYPEARRIKELLYALCRNALFDGGNGIVALRFRLSEEKAIEALVWIANEWPNITPFYVAKAFFLADKDHLNKYGRPVLADRYISMPWGPVPSAIRDFIEGNYLFSERSGDVVDAFTVNRNTRYPEIRAERAPRLDVFSESDLHCLRSALDVCRRLPFKELSDLTHRERAWVEAQPNGTMDYLLFIDDDNPHRDAIIEQAEEFSALGVM